MLKSKSVLQRRLLSWILTAVLLTAVLALAGCASSDETDYDWGDLLAEDPKGDAPDGADESARFTDTPISDDEFGEEYPPETAPEIDFVVEDQSEALKIDTYLDEELLGTRMLYIYDADYLDLFFGEEPISTSEILGHIDQNPQISGQYKQLLSNYVTSIAEKYPEADLRPLDYNIRTLEVVECDEFELAIHTLSFDAYGCYVQAENRIYVPKDYTYQPGTWEYQVIMHEFGHVARTVSRTDNKLDLHICISSELYTIPEEALNSIFTVSLFDYAERDIAYQLQSNMFLILTDCCDGYKLSDYLNHSLSYFAHMLDVQNGDNNYALTIMKLMEVQREDGVDDDYERPQEIYYPIYDYLTKMYLEKYGSDGMSDEEIDSLVDEMLDIILFDVPEEYHIDTAEFYRFAHEYRAG